MREFGQYLLRQHARRDGTDMAAGFHSFDHQRIDARADQFLSERQRRRKADDLGARRLDRFQAALRRQAAGKHDRSEEHTSELKSLMRISYAVFCLKKKTKYI